MRTCGRCGGVPRRDDPLQVVQWDCETGGTSTAAVCVSCEALVRGEAPPAALTYPVGCNARYPVCGVCRLALRDDDDGQAMRLHETDITAAGSTIKPGCYMSCRDCVERFRHLIADRIGRPVEATEGQWLQ